MDLFGSYVQKTETSKRLMRQDERIGEREAVWM